MVSQNKLTEDILVEPLTNREYDVLVCLAERLSNSEIAERLVISTSTVKWYIRQLNSKLYATNRRDIVQRARTLGLLDGSPPNTTPVRHNLPSQPTPFVGRQHELNELHALLAEPDNRLVTILAPGGMGKTRLALQVGEEQQANFTHGVCFIPLHPLSNPEQIITEIAKCLGIGLRPGSQPANQQVLEYLSNKNLLLLLDNYEHLLEGFSIVVEILEAAPDVKLLVTSRERLRLSGETVYVLKGMKLPQPDILRAWKHGKGTTDCQSDAVQLLLQTAHRVKPGWEITDDNLKDIERVCHLTEGMPLGIILAASWLDVYSLDRICDEIQQNIDFLDTDMRDIPPRQRSIQAVFQSTWNHLTENEQQVFMKMSVFHGGCSPQAAETVASANPRVLQALVNKALLIYSEDGHHYTIDEMLRQYAAIELAHSGQADTIRHAHAHYYAATMEAYETDMKGGQQGDTLDNIEMDFENIQVAWMWAVQQRDYKTIDQILETLLGFCFLRYRHQSAQILLDLALQVFSNATDDRQRAVFGRLLTRRARLFLWEDANTEAKNMVEQALNIAREMDDPAEQALALNELAVAVDHLGHPEEAYDMTREALDIARTLEDRWIEGRLLSNLAYLAAGRLNRYEEGYQLTLDALAVKREVNDQAGTAQALHNLGLFATISGQLDQAESYYKESLVINREIDAIFAIKHALDSLASNALNKGDFETAEAYIQEVQAIEDEYNHTVRISPMMLATYHNIRGNYAQAKEIAEAMLAASPSSQHVYQIERYQAELGVAEIGLGNYEAAARLLYAILPHMMCKRRDLI